MIGLRFEFDVPRLKPGRARVIDVVVSSPALRGIINTYKSSACAHACHDTTDCAPTCRATSSRRDGNDVA